MKIKLNPQKLTGYLKTVLICVLLVMEILISAQASLSLRFVPWLVLTGCCVALFILEAVNEFKLRNFAAKIVFYSVEAALLLVMCVLSGEGYLSVLFCVVLTGCYITVESFRDRTIFFGSGCAIFCISYLVGRMIGHPLSSAYKYAIDSLSGMLFGLFAISLDYVVAQFIIKFYNTNRSLSAALAEKERSQAQLEAAYEQLTRTRVYEERNRIANDIHDNAGHSMTTVIMQTEAAKLLIDDNPQEAKACIISANIQARNALEQMRESVHLLAGKEKHNTIKEDLQLIIEQTMDGTGVRVRSDIADATLPEEIHLFLCNTLKELLSNGIRHGKATAFYVEFIADRHRIKLLVSDNGMGVAEGVKLGFGLKTITEKTEKFGGKCVFSNESGEGFEATIYLPAVQADAEIKTADKETK